MEWAQGGRERFRPGGVLEPGGYTAFRSHSNSNMLTHPVLIPREWREWRQGLPDILALSPLHSLAQSEIAASGAHPPSKPRDGPQ